MYETQLWKHKRVVRKIPMKTPTKPTSTTSRASQGFCYLLIFGFFLLTLELIFIIYVYNRVVKEEGDNDGDASDHEWDKEIITIEPHQTAEGARNTSLPPGCPYTDYWQRIKSTRDKLFIFSAYYEDRLSSGKYIRVIGVAPTRNREKIYCKLYSGKKGVYDNPIITSVLGRAIRENWNLKYSAYYYNCRLPADLMQIPMAVSLTVNPRAPPTNCLIIKNRLRPSKPLGDFAVCVKPLHFYYNQTTRLLEFIELNRLLGVVHFTFYNHTIGKDVNDILLNYVSEGVVSILPWKLEVVSQKEIRTEGLFAALNDCLYRNMYRFRYLLMIDLDEFIIPHKYDTLGEMVTHLNGQNPERYGAYSFKNCFFYLQWPDDEIDRDMAEGVVTLHKTRRRAHFHPHKQRSKCIIVPEHVVEMGNHFVWEFTAEKALLKVPPEEGFLHHYRVCEFGGDDCVKAPSTIDRTAHKYKSELLRRIAARL